MSVLTTSLPAAAAPVRPAAAPSVSLARQLLPLAVFLGAHVIAAMLMRAIPLLSTMHALVCLVGGLLIAARRPLHETAFVVAYIAGAEVLWRMTHAGVFWEYGKYAISAICFVALLRVRVRRNRITAIGYFALLLPSVLLTVMSMSPDAARQQISFNLSGPLALTLCVLLFSNVRLTADQLRTTFFAAIGPVLGITTIAYLSTATAEELKFVVDSNSVTSGGFGPNQVSAMLGLGLLFSLLMLLERKLTWRTRAPLLVLAVAFATQAALTFSRGGLALAFLGAFGASFYLVRDRRARATLAVLGSMLFAVARYVVIPRLEVFTSGKLAERYTSIDPSGRTLLASFDLQIFADHPLLGVGPGAAGGIRQELGHFGAAHTEYTRMLAEHGLLGALAIVLLAVLAVRTIRQASTIKARAFVVAMLIWVGLFLAINAMRLAAPAFLLGVACCVAHSSRPPRGAAR